MHQEKYIGMDLHPATISVPVMDAQGKLLMECLLEWAWRATAITTSTVPSTSTRRRVIRHLAGDQPAAAWMTSLPPRICRQT